MVKKHVFVLKKNIYLRSVGGWVRWYNYCVIAPPEKCLNRDDLLKEKLSHYCDFYYLYVDTVMFLIKIVMADMIGIQLYKVTSLSWILKTLQPLPLSLPLPPPLPLTLTLHLHLYCHFLCYCLGNCLYLFICHFYCHLHSQLLYWQCQ